MFVRSMMFAAAALSVAGCASYSNDAEVAQDAASAMAENASEKPDCFYLSQINGYTHAGRNKIHVSTGPRDTYEFETLGSCPELRDAETMGFDQTGGGRICRGIDIDLIVPTSIGPRRCPVSMIRKLPEPAD